MKKELSIEEEVELDLAMYNLARERASDIVLDRGLNEDDDDFIFEVHIETKHQWDILYEERHGSFEDFALHCYHTEDAIND